MKITFEAGEGRKFQGGVNYMVSEDGRIYAECLVPEGASEDFGYLTLKAAILEQVSGEGLEFWYDGQEGLLEADAGAPCDVYTEIEADD